MSCWSRFCPAGITFYPFGSGFSTVAELALLVSSLSEFCPVSLWPVNFFTSTISGTSFFLSFVSLSLGVRSLKYVKFQTLTW